jgi:outer membrane lipoprotein carrier protein
MFDKGGNRYKYTIAKFNPNVKVDDSFFTFDPKKYPGVEVIDLR